MARFSPTIDHVCMNPKGRVNMGAASGPMTKEQRIAKRRADTRSFVATTRYRAALNRYQIVQHDSSWCVMADGEVVARFATPGEAASFIQ